MENQQNYNCAVCSSLIIESDQFYWSGDIGPEIQLELENILGHEISGDQPICSICFENVCAQTDRQPRHADPEHRCVWCLTSLFRRRSQMLGEGPELRLISEDISPRMVPDGSRVCYACWVRARRHLLAQGTVRDQPPSTLNTCVWCQASLGQRRSHSIPEGQERSEIAQRIFPREIPPGGLVCYACWVSARRNVEHMRNRIEELQEPGPSHSHRSDLCTWCGTSLFRRHTHILSGAERDQVAARIYPREMTQPYHILFLALSLQMHVSAAPSDVSELKNIAKVETADIKLDTPITLDEASKDTPHHAKTDETQGQRQKRFYNYYGYGFPPMNPVLYPGFDNRNNAPFPGGFSAEDPFSQIYKRLQDVAGVVRAPNFNHPPPPPPFPIFFPVIYIPFAGCGCTPSQQPNKPVQPNKNGTDPNVDISNRFPEMEDERQNWGIVVDPNDPEQDDEEEDFTRPISFVPIKPDRTTSRPPPAVEHGTNQGSGSLDAVTTTTTVPPPVNQSPPSSVVSNAPTACDAAVLSCCHQAQVTYDCFVAQGCPDPTGYGNPCDVQVILSVINRFQSFYGQRTG